MRRAFIKLLAERKAELRAPVPPELTLPPGAKGWNEGFRNYVRCREAGYSPYAANQASYSSRWMPHLEHHPETQAALARLRERVGISVDDVLLGFLECVRRAATSEELRAAWREIARMKGWASYSRPRGLPWTEHDRGGRPKGTKVRKVNVEAPYTRF